MGRLLAEHLDGTDARPDDAKRRALIAALALAAAAGALVVLPSSGPLAWLAFGLATAGAMVALASAPNGPAWGAAALFALAGVKDGLLVVERGYVSVLHAVALALVLVTVARALRTGTLTRFRLSALEWALAGPFAAGLWSLATSLAPATTLAYTARLLGLWVVAVVVARTLASEADRRRALAFLVAGGVVAASVGFVQWAWPGLGIGNAVVQGDSLDGTLLVRPAAFFWDPNFLGTYLVLSSLAGLSLALGHRRRVLWAVPVLPILVVVALTYSRSAWLSLIVGAAVLVLFSAPKARLVLVSALAAAALIGAALVGPASLLARFTSALTVQPDSSGATRLLMAQSALEMIRDRPIFGTGLEAFSEAYSAYRKPGALVHIAHPHQVPLPFVAETGIAGALAQLALAATALVAARRVASPAREAAGVAAVAGLAALGVGMLLQFFLYYEPLWLVTALLAASAWPAAPRGEGAVSRQARRPPRTGSDGPAGASVPC